MKSSTILKSLTVCLANLSLTALADASDLSGYYQGPGHIKSSIEQAEGPCDSVQFALSVQADRVDLIDLTYHCIGIEIPYGDFSYERLGDKILRNGIEVGQLHADGFDLFDFRGDHAWETHLSRNADGNFSYIDAFYEDQVLQELVTATSLYRSAVDPAALPSALSTDRTPRSASRR